MLYQRRTFTCPASSGTSQITWDRAFLSEADFIAKYGEATVEFHTDHVPATLPEHCGTTLVVTN